jgi:threonine/homoserine/homoserine lactone efflux protein|tara:strand:- start:450 stop:791 length:342 start_codon:yes stop_codon:yes gene_type:complete
MFSAKVIFIIIIIHVLSGLLGRSGKIESLQRLFLLIDLISTSILIFIGLDLLIGWTDPFSGANLAENSRAAVRGGFIILIIKYWPYCLIGWCLYSLFYFVKNGFWSFLFKNKN